MNRQNPFINSNQMPNNFHPGMNPMRQAIKGVKTW